MNTLSERVEAMTVEQAATLPDEWSETSSEELSTKAVVLAKEAIRRPLTGLEAMTLTGCVVVLKARAQVRYDYMAEPVPAGLPGVEKLPKMRGAR